MLGETISHYKIIEKLGQGGMGEVYLAEDTRLGRKVAIKFLAPELARDRESLARFRNEAKAAAELSHPNIATIHDIGDDEGKPFLVLEYVEGKTLKERLAEAPLSITEVLRIGKAICSGLARAHAAGIVHRDIKSANIMVANDGEVKILDFGLAHRDEATQLTRPGTTLGTLSYMSPEQAGGQPAHERSDIWSVGVVLYECVTGTTPFLGPATAVLAQVQSANPQPPTALRSGVPLELEQAILRCLEKDPDLRFQHADDLLATLKGIESHIESGSFPRGISAEAGLPPRHRRGLWLGALAVVIVAAVAVSALFFGKLPPPGEGDARTSLAVMYFENLPDPGDAQRDAEILANLLITGLTETAGLTVLSSQHLHDILRARGESGTRAINRNTALEIARLSGMTLMVTGSLLRTQPGIDLTTQIVDVSTGEVRGSQRIQGEPGQDVFDVAQALLDEIVADLGLGRGNLAAVALDQISSTSAVAYRHYLDGLEHRNAYRHELARDSFERAVAADSTFAMAYFFLTSAEKDPQNLPLVNRALRNARTATQAERELLEAVRDWLSNESDRALARVQALAASHPNEKEIHRFAAKIEWSRGNARKAIPDLERVLELDPLDPGAMGWLSYWYYLAAGDTEKGLAMARHYVESWPHLPDPYDTLGDLLHQENDCDGANDAYLKAIEVDPDWMVQPYVEVGCYHAFARDYEKASAYFREPLPWANDQKRLELQLRLTAIFVHQGQFREAIRRLDSLYDLEGMRANSVGSRSSLGIARLRLFEELGLAEEAEKEWQNQVKLDPNNAVKDRNNRIEQLARRGDLELARTELALLEQEAPEKFHTTVAASMVEMYAGNSELALTLAADVMDIPLWNTFVHYRIALTELAAGELESAAHRLQAIIELCSPSGQFNVMTALRSFLSHYYLAVALDRAGHHERALASYRDFLDMARNSDAELEIVSTARRRVTALQEAGR